jgi:hypothetical protein
MNCTLPSTLFAHITNVLRALWNILNINGGKDTVCGCLCVFLSFVSSLFIGSDE